MPMKKAARTCFAALAMLALFALGTAYAAGEVHGNAYSRIYHNSGCRYYMCKNCTVVFASAAEAQKAGFRACKICGG